MKSKMNFLILTQKLEKRFNISSTHLSKLLYSFILTQKILFE